MLIKTLAINVIIAINFHVILFWTLNLKLKTNGRTYSKIYFSTNTNTSNSKWVIWFSRKQ